MNDEERKNIAKQGAEEAYLKFLGEKPDWFKKHEKDDDDRFKQIIDMLTPFCKWFEEMTVGKNIKLGWYKTIYRIAVIIGAIGIAITAMWAGFKFIILKAMTK